MDGLVVPELGHVPSTCLLLVALLHEGVLVVGDGAEVGLTKLLGTLGVVLLKRGGHLLLLVAPLSLNT